MTNEIVTIQPGELTFLFELKKQSSCSLQLVNNRDFDVAFKVKTTSPKKYCVRPNTGVIPPQSTCDVTVTMQAQKEIPPDMQCKDKFLVQSVMVPAGTTAKDITPDMVKTTSPKKYCVRPNTGVIPPQSTCDVTATSMVFQIPVYHPSKESYGKIGIDLLMNLLLFVHAKSSRKSSSGVVKEVGQRVDELSNKSSNQSQLSNFLSK